MIKKKIAVNIFLFIVVLVFLMTIKNIDSRHVILEKTYKVLNKSTPDYIAYLNDYNFFSLNDHLVIKKKINIKKIYYENEKMNLAIHYLLRNEKSFNNNFNFCFILNKTKFELRDDDGGLFYYKFLYENENKITEFKLSTTIKKYLFFFTYIFLFIFFYKKIIKIKTKELFH